MADDFDFELLEDEMVRDSVMRLVRGSVVLCDAFMALLGMPESEDS